MSNGKTGLKGLSSLLLLNTIPLFPSIYSPLDSGTQAVQTLPSAIFALAEFSQSGKHRPAICKSLPLPS